MKKEHELRQEKMSNLFPFLLLGQPSFNYACFEDGIYEYDTDWTIDENCFLINCKCHFQNSKRLVDHETIHKKHNPRRKAILPPFWKFIKINTPEQSDPKFFDYLDINNHPWFKSQVHRCDAKTFNGNCKFLGATKTGHEHQSDFKTGCQAVLIQTWESRECYYLDGTTEHFYDSNERIWLGNPLSWMARQAQKEAIDQL
jgi:hypothetical protein